MDSIFILLDALPASKLFRRDDAEPIMSANMRTPIMIITIVTTCSQKVDGLMFLPIPIVTPTAQKKALMYCIVTGAGHQSIRANESWQLQKEEAM